MINKLVTPSRWGGGVSLLWRGNTFSNFITSLFQKIETDESRFNYSFFAFDSARNALFHYLKSEGIGKGDIVQVMYYTCDAVTDVLVDLECEIKFYDCDSGFKAVDFELEENCKLLISQVSFGKYAHSFDILDKIESKGTKVLLDKSLSYGIMDFDHKNDIKFPTILSFEVSKSITFGWAGLLCTPKKTEFKEYYRGIKKVPLVVELYRTIVTIQNLFFVRHGNKLNFLIWILSKMFGLQRASSRSSLKSNRSKSKLGYLSRRVVYSSLGNCSQMLTASNKNHQFIAKILRKYKIQVNSHVDDNVSSPRIHFSLPSEIRDLFVSYMADNKIEVGLWFNNAPIKMTSEKKYMNTSKLFDESTNLPCHWTLRDDELIFMKNSIDNFFKNQILEYD